MNHSLKRPLNQQRANFTRVRRCLLGEGLELGGVAEVGPSAVEEEAEAIDGEQVAQGPFPVRPAERRHLHRRPHLI